MNSYLNRRRFVKTLLAGAGAVSLPLAASARAAKSPFSFALLGDLHYDKLTHHDLEWLQREKPDDLRQAREYSTISADILPRLFATVRDTIIDLNHEPDTRTAFCIQLGDLVEGLCGNEKLATRQDTDALEFVRAAGFGVPFVFTKGNHDITGAGAADAFRGIFEPFLAQEVSKLNGGARLERACFTVERGDAAFFFFDAYDQHSLEWLEAALARRTARHCFVIVHPPVVPYGARATWYVFSAERERARRERLLELLGHHNAFVLGGHIHKYNLLVRKTGQGGRFVQLGLSSVIRSAEVKPEHVLSGVDAYNPDQVKVEPNFSPATEQQRREVYHAEAPMVTEFQYADLPGYAVVSVGAKVEARIYSGITRQLWRTHDLTGLLEA